MPNAKIIFAVPLALAAIGCTPKVQVIHKVPDPIQITIDVNVKIDKDLDSFFDFEEEQASEGGTK